MSDAERLVYAAAFAVAIIDGTYDASTRSAYQIKHATERACAAVLGLRLALEGTEAAFLRAFPASSTSPEALAMLRSFCAGGDR